MLGTERSHRQVIYLTGAPATGKTTTATLLGGMVDAKVLSYGALLTERTASVASQSELRERSAQVIEERDVKDLDAEIAALIRESTAPCIIDSHAVTKEAWGFRAVPYSHETIRQLGITSIVVLYASPQEIGRRIGSDSQGRPLPDELDLRIHQDLQMNLALTYAHTCHVPAYFVKSEGEPAAVARQVARACGFEDRG
ncbi:ATP-binding protein [Cellulomonas sp. NS3]|uniref:ATP-binding protein n=1 Tax=Cellulomonas sp. NS3 TaxID=2973977 RepID=UPI0021617721|nr:ATP-binding protein [Cellulomonas sp. NS3]